MTRDANPRRIAKQGTQMGQAVIHGWREERGWSKRSGHTELRKASGSRGSLAQRSVATDLL